MPSPEERCSGGQTFGSRGLEAPFGNAVVGLVRQAMGCPTTWVFRRPPNMRKLAGVGGTPNHRLLWRVWYRFWAERAGTEGEKQESHTLLTDFLLRQFGKTKTGPAEGQLWGETLTTSHYQIWLLGTAGARYLARHHQNQDLIDLTGQWFRRELYGWNLLERDGHVFSPGSRSSINHVDVRTVARSMLMGVPAPARLGSSRPIPGRPNEPDGPWWVSTYNVGTWILRELLREGDDVGGTAGPDHVTEPTVLRNSLLAYSRGADWLFLFPYYTKASDALWWTSRINGHLIDSPYHPGQIKNRSNPYPPPDMAGAKLKVVEGAQDPAKHSYPEEIKSFPASVSEEEFEPGAAQYEQYAAMEEEEDDDLGNEAET